MKNLCLYAITVMLAACTATPQVSAGTQAIRDYIEVSELEEVDRIRTYGNESWGRLSDFFVVYKARNERYLIEFHRVCRELRDHTIITPDRRRDHNNLYAGEDTLRGCRIARMFPISKAQADELENLADAMGARN